MKREIKDLNKIRRPCCPGHDKFPSETYRNRRSKKARAEGKKIEHRVVRRITRQKINKDLE